MLKAMFKKIGKSKKGFTLIELLVVIAILGILAAILIPVVGNYVSGAKITAANTDAHTVYTAAVTAVAQGKVTIDSTVTGTNVFVNTDRPGTGAVANKIYNSDLTSYLGSHSFTISNIWVVDGNVVGAQVSGGTNGAGTYGTVS